MEAVPASQVIEALKELVQVLISAKEQLSALDSATGDGDLGVTMAIGAQAIEAVLLSEAELDIGNLLVRCGIALGQAAPSTMGTLLATALVRAGKAVQGKQELAAMDLIALSQAAVQGIRDRGQAAPGDKTVLDALIPAVEALEHAILEGAPLHEAVGAAATAARIGAESTARMVARAGRARWLGDRTMGHPDAGAVLCQLVFEALARNLGANSSGQLKTSRQEYSDVSGVPRHSK